MKENQRYLGIYIHIPFCKHKCAYCDFYSLVGQESWTEDYVAALCAHLMETAPFAKGHVVDTVYIGGGTPTLLGAKGLVTILKTVSKHYRLAKGAEITVEANPESAQEVKLLKAIRKAGCNRISLGMQSAHSQELAAVGRIHTVEQVKTAVDAVGKAKVKNLSLDLIYGLPGQTKALWMESLAAAVALSPQHLSCYGLKLEENTPLFAQKDQLEFPDEDTQAAIYLETVAYLEAQGYHQYEISNFAKTGFQSRHNLKYWTLGEYAGFGPGAHSDFGDVRYGYHRDLEGYIQGVTQGGDLLSESTTLDPMDRDTEWLMLGLRLTQGIDAQAYTKRFRRSFDCFLPFVNQCIQAGYMAQEGSRYWLTPKGFLVSNQIIGGMLDALAEEKIRRAQAKANKDYRIVP